MAVKMNLIEEEIVFLRAAWELIDSMVNWEMFNLHGNDPNSSILFKSGTHQQFFNILLVDFLSCADSKAPVRRKSYLAALESITENPHFDTDSSVASLERAIDRFVSWLNEEVEVDAWLPSIDTQATLRLTRFVFLKMCGNICKHNFLRLCSVAEQFTEILSQAGITVESSEALLALGDFQERFHTDIFNYHSSTIAEFLNDIRWGIYEYLQPEYHRSIVRDSCDQTRYRYTYPQNVANAFAKTCYWELMNEVRNHPYMRRFQVTEHLKTEY